MCLILKLFESSRYTRTKIDVESHYKKNSGEEQIAHRAQDRSLSLLQLQVVSRNRLGRLADSWRVATDS